MNDNATNLQPSHCAQAARWAQWRQAAKQQAVDIALRQFYIDLDAEIKSYAATREQPLCNASGRCCKFNTYDHLLYVTGLEITWFLGQIQKNVVPGAAGAKPQAAVSLPVINSFRDLEDGCRYQIDGLCSTHAIRPLGCRVYFCQEGTDDWQHDLYERYLKRLIELHELHGVDYRYMEWRSGLLKADHYASGS